MVELSISHGVNLWAIQETRFFITPRRGNIGVMRHSPSSFDLHAIEPSKLRESRGLERETRSCQSAKD